MELLLLLYAMLAGVAGLSGQAPARTQQVALGSTAAIEAAEAGSRAIAAARTIASARVALAIEGLRVPSDARRIDAPLTRLALVPLSRQAPERRLE